jgi:hypothetical protein
MVQYKYKIHFNKKLLTELEKKNMSFIPKYILKRMFPDGCAKNITGGVEITMVNVISPLGIDDGVPESAENHIDVLIDGKPLGPDLKKKITLTVEGKTYMISKAKEFQGVIIPVGGMVKVFLPIALEKGKEHDFDITIKTDNPFHIKVAKVVN